MPTKQPQERSDVGVEYVLDDIIDLEEYARQGKSPPLAKGYRLKVNGKPFVIHDPNPTGREILTLAGLFTGGELHLARQSSGCTA